MKPEHAIIIEQHFFAWHALRLYDGSVEPMHAHHWHVAVEVAAAELDAMEVVADFHELEAMVGKLLDDLSHRSLNDHPALAGVNPSAEQIAACLYRQLTVQLPKAVVLSSVTVTEAPGCRAKYHP